MFIFLWFTNLPTKATNSSYCAPSVRCLPHIDIGLRLRVLVTHIPCVCMSTFPKARGIHGKVFHLRPLFTWITVFPHMKVMPLIYTWPASERKRFT